MLESKNFFRVFMLFAIHYRYQEWKFFQDFSIFHRQPLERHFHKWGEIVFFVTGMRNFFSFSILKFHSGVLHNFHACRFSWKFGLFDEYVDIIRNLWVIFWHCKALFLRNSRFFDEIRFTIGWTEVFMKFCWINSWE